MSNNSLQLLMNLIGGSRMQQEQSDERWSLMVAYSEDHPDEVEKFSTVGDHVNFLKRFGMLYEVPSNLLQRKVNNFGQFMEKVKGYSMTLMDNYEMENAPKVTLCGHCNKRGVSKKCASCGQFYCDRECQRKDWAAHREGCLMIQDQRVL